MEDFLENHYYYNNDGIKDEIVNSLGDCLVQCAYLILKNRDDFKSDYYTAFLNETTLKLSVNSDDELIAFETIENIYDKDLFSIMGCENTNQNTADKVSEILQSGGIPAIAAIIERFPFSCFYDVNYKNKKKRTRHVFIIVGEDDENFLYVDNPDVISPKRYIAYDKNKEIGIISKKLFRDATQFCCDVLTFRFDMNMLISYIDNPKEVLIKSRDNYYKKGVHKDNQLDYFGRQVLLKLIDLFEGECLRFDDLAPSKDRNMITYFNWKIWNIKGRRSLQRYYFKNNCNTNNIIHLITALEESIKNWDLLYKVLNKDYLKRVLVIGKKYIPIIENIIIAEDELQQVLRRYLDFNG